MGPGEGDGECAVEAECRQAELSCEAVRHIEGHKVKQDQKVLSSYESEPSAIGLPPVSNLPNHPVGQKRLKIPAQPI
jgi:hypothetical protein